MIAEYAHVGPFRPGPAGSIDDRPVRFGELPGRRFKRVFLVKKMSLRLEAGDR